MTLKITIGIKRYELKNHLGNVMATITDRKQSVHIQAVPLVVGDFTRVLSHYQPEVVSISDYYPFGSGLPNRQFSSNAYRYGFNGMEKDDEIKGAGNHVDFGARGLDTRLGRWWSVDPLAAKYPGMSPYNFAANNPILLVDPDGREVRVAGDVKKAEADMRSVLPEAYQSKLKVVDDKLVFDITQEELDKSSDPLVGIVHDLIQSETVYEWNVSNKVDVIDKDGIKQTRNVSVIHGASQKGDRWRRLPETYVKKVRNNGKPVYRERLSQTRTSTQDKPIDPTVDYQRTINPNYNGPSIDDSRKTRVTHEVLELYFEGEKGLPYSTHEDLYDGPENIGAHNRAINVQSTLTDDRKGKNNGSARVPDKGE